MRSSAFLFVLICSTLGTAALKQPSRTAIFSILTYSTTFQRILLTSNLTLDLGLHSVFADTRCFRPLIHRRLATVRPPNSLVFAWFGLASDNFPVYTLHEVLHYRKALQCYLPALHDESQRICKQLRWIQAIEVFATRITKCLQCMELLLNWKGKDQEFQGIDRRRSQRLQQCLVEIWYKHCVQGNQRVFFFLPLQCVYPYARHTSLHARNVKATRAALSRFRRFRLIKSLTPRRCRPPETLLCFELDEKLQTFSELTESYTNRVAIFVDVKDLFQAIKEPGMQPFLDPRNLSDFNFKPCLEVCGLPWFTISQNSGKCARSAIVCFDFDSCPLPLVELHTKVSLLVPPLF